MSSIHSIEPNETAQAIKTSSIFCSDQNNNDKDTVLLYLHNTYLFEGNAKVLAYGNDEKGAYVILDQTIFYPQGGGQPSDVGTIQVNNNTLNVHFVGFSNGKVQHYVKECVDNTICGITCSLQIDPVRRITNAKSHTSGHLLASIVESIAPELVAVKGYHFPDGPSVEFKGKLSSVSSENLNKIVSKIVQEKIDAKAQVIAREVFPEELQNQRNIDYQLPPGKKARVVQIEGYEAVPCGGTHVQNISELKSVSVRKVNFPKGNTKISYTFE